MAIIIVTLAALVLILYYDAVMYERFQIIKNDLTEFKNRTFIDIKKIEENLDKLRKELKEMR
jgi:hypothetical protein